ncbi:MAG: FtsX-like permease family protein [Bacteroidales bacterium]|nr:FtsX-like permease family protein [Bacteroidales bacterium]MDD4216150.1 FtsX-like permease family protein [Bacteroidales bacterium]MDY0141888.1 FtsX-like permease family protein [Bacteroidales bacterium]
MNFPLYIAKRYLISKKSRNAINIISFISIMGVAVGTAALIIILSVFNGFDDLLKRLYNSFDPDIKVIAAEGKTFEANQNLLSKLENIDFIDVYSMCLEENAMLEYGDKQIIATIKGVDDKYQYVTGLDSMIVNGTFQQYEQNIPLGIAGQGIAYDLELSTDFTQPVNIYIPSRTGKFRGNFQDASSNINKAIVYTVGVFMIQQEYDTKYYIVPLETAQILLEFENSLSSLEIKLKKGTNTKDAVKKLSTILGDKFEIQDRNKQHEYAYKIMQTEKWAIFMILVFILLIASFNVIGSLTMLIIDKKQDIQILKSLGAGNKTIRHIFFLEGVFISFVGAIAGLIIGGFICWLQMRFGLVKLGNEGSFIINSYPVLIKWIDFVYVTITVMIIGTFAAWYPVRYITKKFANVEY